MTFHRLGDSQTRVICQMDLEPDGLIEKAGDALGVLDRRVKGDMKRFKQYIEERGGRETGAWRGQVDRPGA